MLSPWKKSHDKPRQHIKKQRHYFADRGPSSQSFGFSIVVYGCESWTIKKAECRRIDAFELWCSRRLLKVPWIARGYNQFTLMEISLGCSWKDWCWSWNSNTLVTWCKEVTHWKILMLGKIEGGRRRGWQKMRLLDGITDSMESKRRAQTKLCSTHKPCSAEGSPGVPRELYHTNLCSPHDTRGAEYVVWWAKRRAHKSHNIEGRPAELKQVLRSPRPQRASSGGWGKPI